MVKVSDIEDRDSLKAWLLDRPGDETKTFAITIAHRAAMRVLPIYWYWVETSDASRKRNVTALPVLRCNLVSGVARKRPLTEVSERAYAAASASASAVSPDSAASAAFAAQLAVITDDVHTAAATVATVADIDAVAWEQVQQDCDALQRGNLLLPAPLWNGAENPFQKEWDTICRLLSKNQGYGFGYGEDYGGTHPITHPITQPITQPVDWSFWINWYQDALEGREPDWDMLAEIALFPDEDWEKGPERVNFLIGEMQAKYLSARAPLAERVEFNLQSASFYTTPQQPKKPDLLAATLSQVADAIEDALADAGNGLRKESREVRVLNRTLQRYSNDPQRIEMDFTSVAIGLRRQIRETKELPESEGNLALLNAVEEGARAIRATHPDVAENRMILAGQALRELPEEDITVLGEAKEVLVAISEGAMAEDFAEDIPQLINDALLPLPNGAPPLPAVDPAVRMFGRVSRMAMMMQKSGEIVEAIHNSRGYKALGIVARGVKITTYLSLLVSIGLRLFGIL